MLRQMIGWLGLLMPFGVRIGAYIFEGIHTTDSISAYYYTGMRDIFVSTLVMVGILLSCYRTPAWHDNAVVIIAGLCAIGIGLFPMDPVFASAVLAKFPEMATTKCYINRGILGYHFIFVTGFFSLTCYLVYFRFEAFTPREPTKQKIMRNWIYKICGLTMFAASLVIGTLVLLDKAASIFWPETVAILSFGIAWLVKGQTVLRDRITRSSA